MQLRWEQNTAQYATGEILYLGKWKVGTAFYDGGVSKGQPDKYKATCLLPGMKPVLGHFATEAYAKEAAERAVTHWMSHT